MTWVRYDDKFHSHPKLARLEGYQLPCVGLHLLASSWSADHLTDGHVPRSQIFKLCGDLSDLLPSGQPWEIVNELLDAELFDECSEHGTGEKISCYLVHDYLEYNPSREQVLAEREARRVAGQAGGQASAKARRLANGAPNAQAKSKQNSTPVPIPIPVPKKKRSKDLLSEKSDAHLDAFLKAWNANCHPLPRMFSYPANESDQRVCRKAIIHAQGDPEVLAKAMRLCASDDYYRQKRFNGVNFARHVDSWVSRVLSPATSASSSGIPDWSEVQRQKLEAK